MSFQPQGPQQQVIYQADPSAIQSLRLIRDRLHQICRSYANQVVRIETMDGQVYVGRIISCDRGLLYLSVPKAGVHRGFGPYHHHYNEQILTLVLYELLVITLLYT